MIKMDWPCVILAGGLGTRLKEETEFKPKPMVKIGHQPILWHIMRIYSYFGFKNFIICLGYKGEVIREYFHHYNLHAGDAMVDLGTREVISLHDGDDRVDWKVILAETGRSTMTGGRIKEALKYVASENFLLTYGDGVGNIDIPRVIDVHNETNAVVTLTAVRPPSRFGKMSFAGNLVTEFREKSPLDDGWINGGFFVVNKKIAEYIKDAATVFEQGPLAALARERKLAVYYHEGFWQCMDTQREVELLNELWAGGNAPWAVWEQTKNI
ncbi:MAG: glucose-1-phosphate cytidylyltransferase [Bacillota bacterium]|jgi:glucose-1-phosphate cytidylyltransferase|nr:glucose-1-phosphate cytidylyltransferase [Bacillota bacterium]